MSERYRFKSGDLVANGNCVAEFASYGPANAAQVQVRLPQIGSSDAVLVWHESDCSLHHAPVEGDVEEEVHNLKAQLGIWEELVEGTLNIHTEHVKGLKEAGEALQRLGRLVHLVGRDWNFYNEIPEQLEQELIERATYGE